MPLYSGDASGGLPGDSWPELPGGDEVEEVAAPAPAPAPERPTRRPHAAAREAADVPVDPDPAPPAPAAGADPDVLMVSLPVIRTAERAEPQALPVMSPGLAEPASAPFNRRGPVAVSVGLICAALGAHAFAAWRRRSGRYWPA